jgi:hypothetical protein
MTAHSAHRAFPAASLLIIAALTLIASPAFAISSFLDCGYGIYS